jgi:hypothetical protein
MTVNFLGFIVSLVILFFGIGVDALAQERLCPDGKRSYFGVCPDESNNSRPPDIKPPQKFPPCPSNQWFREWHMCHAREDLGGGLVIDADFVNGAVYDPSMPTVQPGTYTFIDKFNEELDEGPLRLGGASVFVNFAELIKDGSTRKFKLLVSFDRKNPYMLSKRIGVDSVAVPLTAQCRPRTFSIEGKVTGFFGAQGNGYPLIISEVKSDANELFKEADIQKASREAGGAALQAGRVVANVLNSVCRP